MSHNYGYLLLDVPVAFTRPVDEIIETATEIGRHAGFDLDWVPDNLEEAVYEIILSAGGPEMVVAKGVRPRLDLVGTPQEKEIFSIRVALNATEDEEWLRAQVGHLKPDHWPDTMEAVCLSVLMEQCAPVDYEIEILEQIVDAPSSNHERMAREARITASCALGAEA